MRTQITSSSRRGVAKSMRVKRDTILLIAEDERIEIPIDEGIASGVEIPPAGTELTNVSYSVNAAGDILYGFHPAKGSYIVRFWKFAVREDEEPRPRVQQGGNKTSKDGRKWYQPDKLVFTVLLKVQSGEFKGSVIPYMLDYAFERDTSGDVYIKAGKKTMDRIITFLDLAGLDVANETIRWTDNILPDLEMLLSERAEECVFQVTMKDGWIDTLSELPAGFKFVDDEPKRSGRAAVDSATSKVRGKPADDDYDDDDEDEDDEPVTRRTAQVTDEAKPRSRRSAWKDEDDED